MEELFPEKQKLSAQAVQKLKGNQAEGGKPQQSIRPKIPQRTQDLAAGGEEKDESAKETNELIDPQLAACGAQCEKEQQRQHQQTVKHIQHCGKKDPFAVLPPCSQQIIQQSQCPAQQRSLQGKAQLQETIDLHTAAFQPKRRCKNPRRFSCSS